MINGWRSYGVSNGENGPTISKRGYEKTRTAAIAAFQSLASVDNGSSGSRGGTSASTLRGNYELGVMEGTINLQSRQLILDLCRDMYLLDPIAGAAVDLMSNLPFSDFTLSGVNDKKILQTYVQNTENLKLKTLFPAISIDYLVDGSHQSSLDWNQAKGMFEQIISHDGRNIELIDVPIHGADPLLNLKISDTMQKLMKLAEKDPRAKKIIDQLPAIFRSQQGKKGGGGGGSAQKEILLEPASTIYIGRRSFSWRSSGISYLFRIIPVWLMEKALIRGTVESVYMRQRPILHITAGDGMEYEPTDENLATIGQLFRGAMSDPIGAIVATRPDININEVVRGDDFWKWTDSNDQFAQAKLKALGLSDSFLSGDASFQTMDMSLSVFMEQVRAYREMVTREFFYDKLFPSIAVGNGFKKSKRDMQVTSKFISPYETELWGQRGTKIMEVRGRKGEDGNWERNLIAICDGSAAHDIGNIDDITNYYIPTLEWHKQLTPSGDTQYLDLLNSLTEKGVPVPIRAMAAAGGQDLDRLMEQMDDDYETRSEISKHMKKIKKLMPQEEGFGGGGGMGEFSSFGTRRVDRPVKRQFTEEAADQYRVREYDSRGKARYVARASYQRQLEQKKNKQVAESLKRIADGSVGLTKRQREAARKLSPFTQGK